MAGILWIGLPLFIAAGSALLAFYIMQARMEVVLAHERELSAQTRAELACHEKSVEDKVKAAQQEAERRALDNFLGEFRVEERHYLRESKSLFLNKKSMVLEERLYFRNIPLSNWVEHEMIVEEGSDIRQLGRACSVFTPKALPPGAPTAVRGAA
jgi:outer membrane murein-binding lipoprotein Lpp